MIIKFFEKFFIVFIFVKISIKKYNIYLINSVLFIIVIKYIFNHDDIKIRI